jgi:hypothetical protein
MSKEEMRKLGIQSPDAADALSLTFIERDEVFENTKPFKQKPYTPIWENEGS